MAQAANVGTKTYAAPGSLGGFVSGMFASLETYGLAPPLRERMGKSDMQPRSGGWVVGRTPPTALVDAVSHPWPLRGTFGRRCVDPMRARCCRSP